jgi:hypothetical protein
VATTPRKTAASSRKPRTAARSASRPPTTRREVEPEEDFDEPDVTEAEAQEMEAEGHYVSTELCGQEVQVIPATGWRSSWQRMLNQGNLDGFAEAVLHPDDYAFYLEADPTIAEFLEFSQQAASLSGESPGKSNGPAPSSRRTRRR